ncbi:hypothetical protein [Rhodospirillaceae bacterium SYSU D60014]|uniref:hypothetical protein n=1 Tax=Virgifigura deserti TaxID=2268457 RepID=UPI000E66DD3A
MLTAGETAVALTGIWRLAHFDPQGMAYFDRSLEGFWRSFRVAVFIAPFYALLLALHFMDMPVQAGWPRLFLVEGIAYVISWTAFPLAMVYVSRSLDRETEYLGFIIAYNWSAVLQIAVYLPVTLLTSDGVLPTGLDRLVGIFASLLLLAIAWFIVKTALRINGLAAIGIVALDIAISLLITSTTDGMLT